MCVLSTSCKGTAARVLISSRFQLGVLLVGVDALCYVYIYVSSMFCKGTVARLFVLASARSPLAGLDAPCYVDVSAVFFYS